MKLLISTPFRQIVHTQASKVSASTTQGIWCILPRHVDMVIGLVPGLLIYVGEAGREYSVAVNAGTLIKIGNEVRIATRDAVPSEGLETLSADLSARFSQRDEDERRAQTALARLEAGIIRKLIDLEARGGPA